MSDLDETDFVNIEALRHAGADCSAATCSPSPILMPVADITYKGTADYLSAKLRIAETHIVSVRKERNEAREHAERLRKYAAPDMVFPWENDEVCHQGREKKL